MKNVKQVSSSAHLLEPHGTLGLSQGRIRVLTRNSQHGHLRGRWIGEEFASSTEADRHQTGGNHGGTYYQAYYSLQGVDLSLDATSSP